jgi:hypothetical protein
MRKLGLLLLILPLTGCATPPRLWVNDAGEVRGCANYGWGWGGAPAAYRANRDCATDLERLGYAPLSALRLGAMFEPNSLRVKQLQSQMPAERAGLRIGDLVRDIDGRAVRTHTDYATAVNAKASGERTVRLGVDREGQHLQMLVELAE